MPIFRTPYFSPLNVSGCVLWFDAEDTKTMTFSGSTVTSWTSKGSSTVSTSVVSGGFTNPTYTTYNNLPALGFNGTSTYIQTANVSVPGTGTTWITCSVNLTPVTVSTPVDSSVVLATNAPGERAIRYSATGANTYYTINRNLTNTADLLRGQINENANGIRGFMDTASYFTGFTNGTQTVSNTNAVTYVAPANQPFLMGKWASGYLNGYIYESLVYNRVLTLEEYQQVEGYLAQKWGFTASLPANHPFLRILLYRWKVPLARLPYYKVFNPQTISSLVLWLDGRDPAGTGAAPSVGATVSTWIDKSISAKNATAGGTPTYVSGGGINFNGSSWFSNTSFAQNLSQRSIFIIMQETTHPATTGVFPLIPDPSSGLDHSTTNGLTIETTNGLRFYGNSGGYQSDMGNSSLLVKAIYNDNMNVRAGTGFLNGSAATTVTATYTAGTCSGYGVGSRWNGASGISASGALNGVIFEIMYFNSPLGLSDRRNIEGYLAQKWGLTGSLVAGHPSLTLPVGAPATGVGKQTISFLPRPILFSPTSITGLRLWMDATDTSSMTFSSGSNISQWRDKSGLSNHATATGSPVLTGNSINAFPAIVTSSGQHFTGPTSVTGTTLTVFAVAKTTRTLPNNGLDQRLVSLVNGANVDYGRADSVIALFNQGSGSSSITTWRLSSVAGSVIATNTPFQVVSKYDGTNGFIWEDGTSGGSSASSGTFGITKYGIGNQANPTSENWNGSIGEVLIYNVALTDTQRQLVEGYLAWKWGLQASLPVGHPYKSAGPGVIISYGSVQFTYLPVSPYSGNQYLSASVTAPSTDSVTYECWFYQTTQNSGNNSIFSSRTGGGGNGGVQIGINTYWGGFSIATPTFLANYGFAPSLNTWHHIALVRNGTSAWTFYYDGIAKTSDQGATFTFTSTTSTDIFIGAFAESGYPQQFTGHVTNFRYVKGVAVYTGNFTVPTIALTVTQSAGTNISAITAGQTQLLLLQASTGLLTDTANNTTVTNTGTATWNALTPF